MSASLKKILVPVDGSLGANRAAEFAARIAAATGASLTLLHVFDSTAATMGLRALSKDEIAQAKRNISKRAFDAAMAAIEPSKISPQLEVLLGHPAEEIIGYADKDKSDLIVMGSRGLSPMRGLLIGSVSDKVVRHSACPVTIVH